MIDSMLRKQIVQNLHSAIDSEMLDRDDAAYEFYVESLSLVANTLKEDKHSLALTLKDKWNLVGFAKESISRLTILLDKGEPSPEETANSELATAPPESVSDSASLRERLFPREGKNRVDEMLMCRYQRRLSIATSALEKQNLELELARQLVENAAITRNKIMQSSARAMHIAHKQFKIEEKLRIGVLKETDFKKQQLFALSLQFNQGNGWLIQLCHDLSLYPKNDKIARELLDNVLTDNAHPVKAELNSMQNKVAGLVSLTLENAAANGPDVSHKVLTIAGVIKEDLNVIAEVLLALFEPLSIEKNALITAELVNHVYFAQLKTDLISLLRLQMANVERKLDERINSNNEPFCALPHHVEKEAKTKLHYLITLHNPYDMLDCVVHIVKLLATSKFDHDHTTSMGADDLLPRLCQVLISSSLPEISSEAAFMETFMPAEKALGEEGYALTMLQSAIAHLTSDSGD